MRTELAPPYFAGIERSGRPFGAIRIIPVMTSYRRTGLMGFWDKLRKIPDSLGKDYEREFCRVPRGAQGRWLLRRRARGRRHRGVGQSD